MEEEAASEAPEWGIWEREDSSHFEGRGREAWGGGELFLISFPIFGQL